MSTMKCDNFSVLSYLVGYLLLFVIFFYQIIILHAFVVVVNEAVDLDVVSKLLNSFVIIQRCEWFISEIIVSWPATFQDLMMSNMIVTIRTLYLQDYVVFFYFCKKTVQMI